MFTILLILTWRLRHETAENGRLDFEIGDIETSAHLYWRSKKISCRACLSYCFVWWKKIPFKSLLELYFHAFIIAFRIEEKIHTKAVVEVSRGAGEGFFCFPGRDREKVSRNLLSLVKLYQRIWIWNLINHGFTNCGCLHCAILSLQGKELFLQNVRNEIFKTLKMFNYNMRFTRAACWINSEISNRHKNTTLIILLFCHYCYSLLWCNYWRSLMLRNSTSYSRLKSTVQIQLAFYPCYPFLITRVSASAEK